MVNPGFLRRQRRGREAQKGATPGPPTYAGWGTRPRGVPGHGDGVKALPLLEGLWARGLTPLPSWCRHSVILT